jgi:hypothetical protein
VSVEHSAHIYFDCQVLPSQVNPAAAVLVSFVGEHLAVQSKKATSLLNFSSKLTDHKKVEGQKSAIPPNNATQMFYEMKDVTQEILDETLLHT